MTNLSVNFLMDGYENEPSAERALFSLLDQAPFKSVHISAGAKVEQGFSIAKKTRARYPNMLVFFRKLPNDFQHLHYPDVNALYESLAPWSDGGNLILPLENEPGVGDLQQQNAWYAPAIERFGKAGIRVTAPAMQTHNRFPSSMLLDTWIALDKYNGFIDLHYYGDPGDDTYSFPIDHIHKTIAAYCKPKGIATRFLISELGYLYRLGVYAGYHGGQGGGLDSATYAKFLVDEARANPDVLYFVFGMGNQAPWGECNIDGDEGVIKPIVAYNKESVVPVVNIPSNPGDGVAAEVITSGLRMRADANGAYLRAFVHGERVTLFPDTQKTVPGSAYTWAFLHDGFNNPGWAAPKDLNGTVWINPVETLDTPIKKLDVPYNSQSDTAAKRYKNDCGAAACLMMLRYAFVRRGLLDPVKISVDDMASDTSLVNADDGLTVQELKALMAGYGLETVIRKDLKPDTITQLIDDDQPVLALVNYGLFNPPDTFNGGHFCVITAYGARGYWTHDPYSGGADFYVSNEVLDASMRDVLAFSNHSYEGLTLAA